MCNDWLAVDQSDCNVERILPVADNNQIANFGRVFDAFAKKDFSDGHLWFSRKIKFKRMLLCFLSQCNSSKLDKDNILFILS